MVAIQFAPPPVNGGGIVDPSEILRREELARLLQERSAGVQQIESPWEGLAQMSDAVFGGMAAKRAADERSQNNKFLSEALGGAMQGELPPDKLNQIMALDPNLGMQLYERQQARAEKEAQQAQEQAERQRIEMTLRSMGADQEADAFAAGIIPAAKAYELMNQTPEPPAAPDIVERFNPETGQPEKMRWDPQANDFVPFGGPKAPTAGTQLSVNPDGTVNFSQGGKITEGQGKDLGFYTRGVEANSQLSQLDTQLVDWGQQVSELVPLGLGNYARTPAFRQAKVAADNFLAVILRKDTGAAVTPSEFDLYGPMFLPVPGDDPGTIQSKRRMREVAILAIQSGLGTAQAVAQANNAVLGVGDPMPILNGASPQQPEPAMPQQTAPQSGPAPGMVEDGYVFMGGDPADPNNWKPVT